RGWWASARFRKVTTVSALPVRRRPPSTVVAATNSPSLPTPAGPSMRATSPSCTIPAAAPRSIEPPLHPALTSTRGGRANPRGTRPKSLARAGIAASAPEELIDPRAQAGRHHPSVPEPAQHRVLLREGARGVEHGRRTVDRGP